MKKHKQKLKHRRRKLLQSFGVDEYGFADLPRKISGTTLRRLEVGESSGCSICFPHGYENYNSTLSKNYNDCNWKRYRPTQWKKHYEESVYPRKKKVTYKSGYSYTTETNTRSRDIQFNGWTKIWKRGKTKWYQKRPSSVIG